MLPSHPELSRALLQLRENCPVAMLSGSGSAVFGVVSDRDQAERLAVAFRDQMGDVFVVEPVKHGVQIVEGRVAG